MRSRIPHPARAIAFLAAAVLAGVPGCATVTEARLAQDPASAIPGERTPTVAEMGLPRSGPVALADLVRVAVSVHPTAVKARRDAEAAEARVTEAEAARLPQVSTSASAAYRDQKETSVGTGAARKKVDVEHRFKSFGFDVSWLVFDFGRTAALERSAGEQWLAAQADVRTTEVEVAFGVRNAYFELQRMLGLLEVARETVRQYEARLFQARELVRVGTRIPYDATKAEVDLGDARLAEVKARNALLLAQANLVYAMGFAEVVDWTPEARSTLPATSEDFEAAVSAARASHPVLASAEAREFAASALIDARVAELYPSLSLSLGYTAAGPDFPLPWSWQAGPGVRWTPFDGFRNLSTIEEAVAGLRAARATRAAVEQRVWLEVRTAWLSRQDARERRVLSALSVRNAGENLTLAQGRFDEGLGTSIELADAQQALALARAEEIQAKSDEEQAAARLLRALGY